MDEASKNIRIRANMKLKMAEYGKTDAAFVEAEMVSASNNMFWMFMEKEKEIAGKPDMQRVYDKWCVWAGTDHSDKRMKNCSAATRDKMPYSSSLA